MVVKCQVCKTSLDREKAYKVTVGKVNKYYCNEDEYKNIQIKKELKDNIYKIIFNCFGRKITNTILYKEITELENVYGLEKIYNYVLENSEYISGVLSSKGFSSEYAQIRYFTAILKNNLADFVFENDQLNKVITVDVEINKFKTKRRRKPLVEFEEEAGEEL